jgi:hypothetical protein
VEMEAAGRRGKISSFRERGQRRLGGGTGALLLAL